MNYNWSFISTFSFILFPRCFPFSRGPRSFWKEIRTVVNHRTSHRAVRSNFYPSARWIVPLPSPFLVSPARRVISALHRIIATKDNDSREEGESEFTSLVVDFSFRNETIFVENSSRSLPFTLSFSRSICPGKMFLPSLSPSFRPR